MRPDTPAPTLCVATRAPTMSSKNLVPDEAADFEVGVKEAGPLVVRFDGGGPQVLRLVLLENRNWEEWSEEEHSTLEWHLHWRSGRFKPSNYRIAVPYQRLNHLPRSSIITKKDSLQKSLRRYHGVYGSVYDFYPQGFILPTEYTKFLREYRTTGAIGNCGLGVGCCSCFASSACGCARLCGYASCM